MIKHWLKSKLPRSLFGRAMLILAVPVIVVQVVVAIFFAERLFWDVSEQMSSSVALNINYAVQEANTAPDIETAQARLTQITAPLDILAQFHTPPPQLSKPLVLVRSFGPLRCRCLDEIHQQ